MRLSPKRRHVRKLGLELGLRLMALMVWKGVQLLLSPACTRHEPPLIIQSHLTFKTSVLLRVVKL